MRCLKLNPLLDLYGDLVGELYAGHVAVSIWGLADRDGDIRACIGVELERGVVILADYPDIALVVDADALCYLAGAVHGPTIDAAAYFYSLHDFTRVTV